ncbi:MAG: hypothetical protein M1825_005106 [Sarcosagium campestre]|nr:MAG: hypothetical protein M1825_005106 [Sarcosagium campestre]
MKRKLSVQLCPEPALCPSITITSNATLDRQVVYEAMDLSRESSFDITEPSPLIDRGEPLSPFVEMKLWRSCAEIVTEYMGAEDTMIQRQAHATAAVKPEPRGRWLSKLQSRYSLNALRDNCRRSRSQSRQTPRCGSQAPETTGETVYKYVPKAPPISFKRSISARPASLARGCSVSSDGPGAGSFIDGISISTTCTTTYHTEDYGVGQSTDISSVCSVDRVPLYPKDADAQSRADARAQTWMAEEQSRGRAAEDRPASRGTHMLSFIRPRASVTSIPSTHSQESLGWRMHQSCQSAENVMHAEAAREEVNLNRPLPPLPSISTWDDSQHWKNSQVDGAKRQVLLADDTSDETKHRSTEEEMTKSWDMSYFKDLPIEPLNHPSHNHDSHAPAFGPVLDSGHGSGGVTATSISAGDKNKADVRVAEKMKRPSRLKKQLSSWKMGLLRFGR